MAVSSASFTFAPTLLKTLSSSYLEILPSPLKSNKANACLKSLVYSGVKSDIVWKLYFDF